MKNYKYCTVKIGKTRKIALLKFVKWLSTIRRMINKTC